MHETCQWKLGAAIPLPESAGAHLIRDILTAASRW
jgi:hypothetical protein